jgi:hypothetical protein
MPSAWQKRDLAKIPRIDPFLWHGVIHRIDTNGMRAVCTRCRAQLRAAGSETVPSEDFYRRCDGTNFAVSRWEGT